MSWEKTNSKWLNYLQVDFHSEWLHRTIVNDLDRLVEFKDRKFGKFTYYYDPKTGKLLES